MSRKRKYICALSILEREHLQMYLYVNVQGCWYIYRNVNLRICWLCKSADIHTCICLQIYIYTYTLIDAYVCVCVCGVCVCVRVCVCVPVCACPSDIQTRVLHAADKPPFVLDNLPPQFMHVAARRVFGARLPACLQRVEGVEKSHGNCRGAASGQPILDVVKRAHHKCDCSCLFVP